MDGGKASQLTGTGDIMRAVGRKVVIMRATVLGRTSMRTAGLATVLWRARVAYMADMMTVGGIEGRLFFGMSGFAAAVLLRELQIS